ncbi:Conidiation protein 6-domain-containing protein [Lenzites betulinus]|nr:Conidiation protein 6-domain-containing protein [Lenzites betulinus]
MSTNQKIGGHKAAINNPRVSEEAKEHSREAIEELGGEVGEESTGTRETGRHTSNEGKDEVRQNAGYKSVLKNPNVGEEAKQHARDVLEDRGEL